MSAKRNTEAQRQFTFAFLARESHVSVEEVAQLYETERERLAAGARITSFLGILVLRNVRETLRKQSLANGPVSTPIA